MLHQGIKNLVEKIAEKIVVPGCAEPIPSFTIQITEPCTYVIRDYSRDEGCPGGIDNWLWTFKNADTGETIGSDTSQHPTFAPDPCVNLIIVLTITSKCGDSETLTVDVSLNPLSIQSDPQLQGERIIFNGESSIAFDSDSQEDEYQWIFKNASTGSQIGSIPFTAAGEAATVSSLIVGGNVEAPELFIQEAYDLLCPDSIQPSFTTAVTNVSLAYTFTLTVGSVGVCADPGVTTYELVVFGSDGLTELYRSIPQETLVFNYTFPSSNTYHWAIIQSNNCGKSINHESITV